MLIILNKRVPKYGRAVRRFVKWLNQQDELEGLGKIPITILADAILPDDILLRMGEEDDIEEVYGVFDPNRNEIFVCAGAMDCTLTLEILAHEVYHAIQYHKGVNFFELTADAWCHNKMVTYQAGF